MLGAKQLAWLFQGPNLIVEEAVPDKGLSGGIPLETIRGTFSDPEIFEIPPVDGPGLIIGVSIGAELPLPPGWRAVPVRQFLSQFTGETTGDGGGPLGRMLRAYHIYQWRADSRFCGSCGAKNIDAPDELARLCPACGRLEFPRIAPAVITLIINDTGEALLAHNKKFTPGVYSLIAGFNEAGESLEHTVVREIREEVNIEVRDIRYIKSQPWPFPNSLMLGFTARYASGELLPDGQEIEDVQWFSPAKLPLLPGNGSVSRYLINRWLAGKI
ncbi:MAG: NAD(+) diphosphatase [Treponema sp.]|nr:NAD(+) diphosphatase [Treponema sp.]